MTRANIIKKVKVKLEEFSNFENQSFVLGDDPLKKPLDSYIEETLDEATREVLMVVPLWLLSKQAKSILPRVRVIDDIYGRHGEIELPSDFVRLVNIKLNSWNREVNDGLNLISHSHPRYKEQRNPATRGRLDKPVAVLCNGKMELYGAAAGDEIEYFAYIPETKAEEADNSLVEFIVLNTAIKIMGIFDDIDGAKLLQEQLNDKIKIALR